MKAQERNTKSLTIVRSGLRRPSWVCRNVKQNVVVARDDSGSMAGQKAKDAERAAQNLVTELAQPTNKDGFRVAIVDFSHRARVVHRLTPATVLDGNVAPLAAHGGTNITSALQLAFAVLGDAESSQSSQSEGAVLFVRPVVLLFTDGFHTAGEKPHDAATRLKGMADLVTVAFGEADQSLLSSLASTEQHFYRCRTGRELRAFLASVGATMTATLSAGINATQALKSVQQ